MEMGTLVRMGQTKNGEKKNKLAQLKKCEFTEEVRT